DRVPAGKGPDLGRGTRVGSRRGRRRGSVMTDRKPRVPKAPSPMPKYKLDATGACEPPTMSEILSRGSPAEVREILRMQGALMMGAQYKRVTHVDSLRESVLAMVGAIRDGGADEVREFVTDRAATNDLP